MSASRDRPRLLGPLGARLALAFLAVALVAVAVLGLLAAAGARSQVADLVRRQHQERAAAVAAAAAQAYEGAGGWGSADLSPAVSIAAAAGAQVEIRDRLGKPMAVPGAGQQLMNDLMSRMHGTAAAGSMMQTQTGSLSQQVTADVLASGQVVGSVALRFADGALPAPERSVRDALLRNVALGAAVAALAALVVAVFVSRRITRPLCRLAAGARAIESGELGARVDLAGEPGELGELGAAFDRMGDALAREDSLRRALVADVAHELRTPVTILQASCEAMVDGIEEPTPARLSSLHDEVLRLGQLVADLETLSSAEAAGLRLERGRVDLAQIVVDAVSSLESRAADAELAVRSELAEVAVDGDRRRLHQVAVNLLANAIKFTPRGGTVTVSTGTDGSLAVLEVADTGPGIPADEVDHVFDRFWRGSGASSTSGSGIGLAVVAELVRAHRGRVELDSVPGEGSRFRVLLPLP